MRYPMQVASDPVNSSLLALFDVTPTTAYVELTEDSLVVKEGNLFHERFALDNLGRANLTTWDWYMGLGLRTDLQGTVAPISSFENAIVIPLKQERPIFLPLLSIFGLQVNCQRLTVSLSDPDSFLVTFNAGKQDPQRPATIEIE